MNSNFESPPFFLSLLVIAGGIITAIALIVGLEICSAYFHRKSAAVQSSLPSVSENPVRSKATVSNINSR